jgi:RNA polymerase sigma-70 factor (ECF subfamily)
VRSAAAAPAPRIPRADFWFGQGQSKSGKGTRVQDRNQIGQFEALISPHLDAAYNLARWLVRNDQDAEDMVQEACLRALKFFGGFRGADSRAWLLTIVRNTCYTWLRQHRAHELDVPLNSDSYNVDCDTLNPELVVQRSADSRRLRQALDELPVEFREVIVLRELEGLSYKVIANIADIPIGTVMSRLACARRRLQQSLADQQDEGGAA